MVTVTFAERRRDFLFRCGALWMSAPEDGGEIPARIFVYAQRQTPMRSALDVTCNGSAVARMRKGSFFALTLPKGRHTIGIESGVPVTVEVRTGDETFVRINWNQHVNRSPIPVLSVVPAERARQEMKFLSYLAAKNIRSESVERRDPRTPEEPTLKRR